MRAKLSLLLTLLIVLVPAVASAKKPKKARGPAVTATRITPYFSAYGAGGAFLVDRPTGNHFGHSDMRAGGGLGTRFEVPVMEYFSLGGLAEFGGVNRRPSSRADLFMDIDFWAKGRYVLDLKPFDLELYAGIPLGMSFVFMPTGGDRRRDFGPGMNVGFNAGAQLLFKRGGFFTDMGPRFRFSRHDVGAGDPFGMRTRQFNFNAGGVLLF